ncbi:MAG: bifunctional alpha/beta hydrolase/OsmC family protein [Hyphomonadaceae bacterium]|nr:bifunctional alpha/beta hydrolase/OsmC family protein [Hyphomonadaceae bacterium]
MQSQRVEFKNLSGETLSGVLELPAGVPESWAIFAHCFTCSKKSLAASRIARGLAERGIGVLRFDFTGLGDSSGDFSTRGFSSDVEDLVAAAEWMSATGRPAGLMIGHSLGGAATIVAATALPDIKAIATIGAPSDAGHVVAQFKNSVAEIEAEGRAQVNLGGRPFVLSRTFLDEIGKTTVIDAARELRKPLLILHAPGDEVVGIDNATDLFIAAKHPKSFVSLDKSDHLLTGKADSDFVADVISGWSARYMQRVPSAKASPQEQENQVLVIETGENGPYQNEILMNGRRFFADEPESLGGADSGPNPYAYVVAGLGACTSITLRMYANHKKWPLQRVSVRLDHEKRHAEDCVDCGPNDRIDVFTRYIDIEGELDDAQRARLLEIADRCPVHRTLEHGAKVETHLVTKPA